MSAFLERSLVLPQVLHGCVYGSNLVALVSFCISTISASKYSKMTGLLTALAIFSIGFFSFHFSEPVTTVPLLFFSKFNSIFFDLLLNVSPSPRYMYVKTVEEGKLPK